MQLVEVNVDWYNSTLMFYLFIMLVSFVFAYIAKKKKIRLTKMSRFEIWTILFFGIIVFVKCLNTTGRDIRHGYYMNFLSADSLNEFRDKSLEIGFRLLCVFSKKICNNYQFFLFVVGIFTVIPVYYFIKKYKDNIDVPSAILMYLSLFFINGFSPMRMALAASISLFAFDAMVEKKIFKAMSWICIAACFHVTALILFIPLMFCLFRIFNRKFVGISFLLLFLMILIGRNSISSLLANSSRYYVYKSFNTVDIGFEQIAYYLPLFFLFGLVRKKSSNNHFDKISFLYLSLGFLCGMMGYIVSIFGRFYLMIIPIIIIIPYYISIAKSLYPRKKIMIDALLIIYCIGRFLIYITQYYNLEDLMPYTNSFGWII